MRITKVLILAVLFVMTIGLVLAQTTVSYKDNSTPICGTALKLNAEYGGTYPTGSGTGRWKIQFFKDGGDNVISPLDPVTHLPSATSDDVALNNANNLQDVIISVVGPNRLWNATGIGFQPSGTAENGHTGDKIFAAIYNNTSIATATKYMILQALYTVPPSGTPAVYVNSTLSPAGWSNWVTFITETAPNPATNGAPTATDLGSANPVTLTWDAPVVDGTHSAATKYDVYFGTTLPGSPNSADQVGLSYLAGVVVPNTTYLCRVVAKNNAGSATAYDWSFQTRPIYNPGVAGNPSPADDASFEVVAFPYSQALSWTAPTSKLPLTGYKVYWNGSLTPITLSFETTTTNISIDAAGTYTWIVVPYYDDPLTKSVRHDAPIAARLSNVNTPKGDAVNCPVWNFTVALEAVADIPAGGNEDIGGGPLAGGANIQTTVDLNYGSAVAPNDPALLYLHNLDNVVDPIIVSYTGTGTGAITMTVGEGTWWGFIYWGGTWHISNVPSAHPLVVPAGGTGDMVFLGVDFDAKGEVIIVLGEGDDPLPVELSSFTATLTSQYFINLTWVTESETGVMGYNVYRSDSNNYASASLITPVVIPATNSSQQQSYTMTDSEALESNHTYYYWLENVDMGGTSNLHGPISATVTGSPVTPLPEISAMSSAYPNPFRMGSSTTIDVNIKANERGTVTVYNILGQAVKTFSVSQGSHKLTWNAKGCASGIYFYKLSTPTMNQTKKLVIVN